MAFNCKDIPKYICAVIMPPIAVFLETGCDNHIAASILLTILGYIPGIIHATIVIACQ